VSCDSWLMNLMKKAAWFANEGIWVVLGWAVIGMFVFTIVLALLGAVGLALP